ncbi:TonB-dependent copper receptor [Xanthomonas translucens]|uniref:TonB-dependent receptor n=3 Tax=Xanthomonas campestris pv. translucens TaxID=343 RepID=A0A125PUI5_XANCT|nr:TonB-dependent copper receptor [Xanthomonas translucens]KTF37315.1 TonB-dependent receptor [Xanthomonas translucens pv. translucens]KWV10232.1 TonB-dependent receptor [Xanthomonas translucens]KWV11253.1 TonB-dependent receptor [Xanthomonas translucens]MCC8446512.1 TonB-dependent copper receptor [Xanthomonas translucens pv. translucens]MCS3360847.1 TonB-dependent copper receptor [Xanthomonas translucens pv. translucens]
MSQLLPSPTRAALSCCVLASLFPAFGRAEASDAITLDRMVVTATAPVAPLTWTVDPKLPRQPVPASDGADYLKTVPGFAAIRNGGTNGDPVLRGMFGSRLNVLSNDGTLVGACPARMDNALSYIAPETFDRLTIVKGPQTVRWGPGASAGTVRFERDTPHYAMPTLEGEASALVGSWNRNDQNLDLRGGSRGGYARLDANRSESDDYRDGDGAVVPSRWRKWNADAALGWTLDPDTVLEFSAGTGDGLARYAGRGMDGSQFRRRSYAARFERTDLPGAWEALRANVYLNDADHVMDNYTLRRPNPQSAMPMPMASNVDRRTSGGRVEAEWRWDRIAVQAGVDTQRSRHRDRSASGEGVYRTLPWRIDAHFDNLGAFAEATFGADTAQRWITGLRLDRAQAQDNRSSIGMMGMPNPTAGQTRREHLGSGFVRVERDLSANTVWYAGLGRSARMPDYWELFSADMGPMGAANAFAGVRPERTTQLDVGLQYRGATLQGWVSAYAGRVQDLILFTYADSGMMGTTTRVDNVDARIAGAEAGLDWQPLQGLTLGGTLAYAWGENRSNGTPLPQMPPLESRLRAEWEGQRWSAGLLLRAVARQGRVAPDQGNVVGRDLGRSAGFATLGLSGGYRVSEALRLSAGVDNVFDRRYSEHLNLAGSADFGFPADPVRIAEPGRNLWLKGNYRF